MTPECRVLTVKLTNISVQGESYYFLLSLETCPASTMESRWMVGNELTLYFIGLRLWQGLSPSVVSALKVMPSQWQTCTHLPPQSYYYPPVAWQYLEGAQWHIHTKAMFLSLHAGEARAKPHFLWAFPNILRTEYNPLHHGQLAPECAVLTFLKEHGQGKC